MPDKRKDGQNSRQSKNHCKVMNRDCIHQRVKRLFLSGGSYTALDVNHLCGGNDARKTISRLRNKDLMIIRDVRLENGCKLYWYVPAIKKGGIG